MKGKYALAVVTVILAVLVLAWLILSMDTPSGDRAAPEPHESADNDHKTEEHKDGREEPDHVHILVSSPPTMASSEIMRRIKGNTSSRLFEEFPHLKKRYWGRHFWARGYFCATVGQMTEEMIKQYLEHHFEPNPNDDFRMEPE